MELLAQARLFAENDNRACMTKGYVDAMLRNLYRSQYLCERLDGCRTYFGIFCVHTVMLDVPFSMRSFEMADKWWISRRSSFEYICAEGGGKT